MLFGEDTILTPYSRICIMFVDWNWFLEVSSLDSQISVVLFL